MTKKINIYSCPTGGWIMNNRKRVEKEIIKNHPDAIISHSCGYPFTIMVSTNGVKGKRDCAFPLFCCPSFITLCSAKKYGTIEYVPNPVEPNIELMER